MPSSGKWVLSQEAFDRLLTALGENRERAGEKYQQLRDNLISLFEWRGCAFPEDHADETINRVAKRMDGGEQIQDVLNYSFGIARLLLLEIQKESARERQALLDLSQTQAMPDDAEDLERRHACLQQCLQKLSPEDRDLILEYYRGEKSTKIENRQRMATRLQISLNTLRMRALRLRDKLETCVDECLKRRSGDCE